MGLRETAQELRELGLDGTLFRVKHELRMRSGAAQRFERPIPPRPRPTGSPWLAKLPFGDAPAVVARVSPSLTSGDREALSTIASRACEGRIRGFGGDELDFGDPVDWYLHPVSRKRWNPSLHWSRALVGAATIGDPKLTWEAARFPQAFHIARAAAFEPARAEALLEGLTAQVEGFLRATPHPFGLHWFSSQELEVRLSAWCFAARVFTALGCDARALVEAIARHAWEAGAHTERELEYARRAVYNNHLIAEALGLYLCSIIAPPCDDATRWSALGRALLEAQAERQFYRDGAYLNLAHNYHRTVLQDYLLATRIAQGEGRAVPPSWTAALERSLDFLVAQQNPIDGALPNYGSNDGSMPRVLSTCAFSDFRPTLQTVSVLTRGARLYPAGPWDEECAWTLGPEA
ncbi:MAG: heparinase II/III family protein, partial [Polyangiales bacterium]